MQTTLTVIMNSIKNKNGVRIVNDYYISTDKHLLDQETIFGLLKETFWSKNIPIEYIDRFIKHSLCFGIYQRNSNKQVGFGRVISDYTTYAYICDITIDPNHIKQGLATSLICNILSHPDLQGLKTWTLRTSEAARKIYERNGFKIAEHPETLLEIDNLDIYSSPNFNNLYKSKL